MVSESLVRNVACSACLALVALLAAAANAFAAEAERLRYASQVSEVDLGVGLWAWPIPMDYDGDGDFDLIISCPDKPTNATLLFENKQGAVKFPIFEPGRRVGPALRNVQASYIDGELRLLVPGYEIVDYLATGFEERRKIYPRDNVHPNKLRANQWRYVDFEGDGDLDLVVGAEDWTEYGWDNAYDEQGRWTNGPLRGFVYVILNNASAGEPPQYAEPTKLLAGGEPVDTYGMPSPNFADFDADGDLDLLCGEFLDGFTYFQNVGSRESPEYAAGKRLTAAGSAVRMDLEMITPVAIDWDSDGDFDLVCGDEDGRVALIEHTGTIQDGVPQFKLPVYFQQRPEYVKFGALVTPFAVDWDGDGDEDLVCGNSAGYIGWFENVDGGSPPTFSSIQLLQAAGEPIRIQAGENGSIQGPAEAKWGYTVINVADWDHDGLLDILANSIWGKVVWFRNIGSPGHAELAAAEPIEVEWPAGQPTPTPAWTWWKPAGNELATQWRTSPVVIDLNEDGLSDLVMLDQEGYLAFFQRERRGEQLVLLPPARIFLNAEGEPLQLNPLIAGKSGRRKMALADWDNDGRIDLLLNGLNVEFWRNVGTDGEYRFEGQGLVCSNILAGHTTCPTVVDWNRDNRPDLVIGAEDGFLYYLQNPDSQ